MWRRRNVITKTEVACEHLVSKYSVQKYQVPVTSTNVPQGLDTFGLNTLILDVSMCTAHTGQAVVHLLILFKNTAASHCQ
jgi:hypothetical protein